MSKGPKSSRRSSEKYFRARFEDLSLLKGATKWKIDLTTGYREKKKDDSGQIGAIGSSRYLVYSRHSLVSWQFSPGRSQTLC